MNNNYCHRCVQRLSCLRAEAVVLSTSRQKKVNVITKCNTYCTGYIWTWSFWQVSVCTQRTCIATSVTYLGHTQSTFIPPFLCTLFYSLYIHHYYLLNKINYNDQSSFDELHALTIVYCLVYWYNWLKCLQGWPRWPNTCRWPQWPRWISL